MNEPFDISTVIFALLAVFVVWKLRSVLGTRTGNERPPFDPFASRRKLRDPTPNGANGTAETGKVIRMPGLPEERPANGGTAAPDAAAPWMPYVQPGSRALDGLVLIGQLDPSFTAAAFMNGARAAYEIIVTAFAAGQRDTLAPLLAKDVLEGFATAIVDREARGDKVEMTFVSMEKSMIEEAQLRGRTAQVTIRFQARLISVTRNREGTVIEGSPDQTAEIIDVWTFARDVDSRNPNWRLVATEGGA
jgi:predicted lipid-binding transport protein (Tim44 family)